MAQLRFFRVFSVLSILLFLPAAAYAVDEGTRKSLVQFMNKLAPQREPGWGWNLSSDPCADLWKGVTCSSPSQTVKKIVLEGLELSGILDCDSLCSVKTISVLSLNDNNVSAVIPEEIAKCKRLTHLYLRSNKFSGKLPKGLSRLNNLKRLDLSGNDFTGELPDLARISGMLSFLAQDNRLEGGLPEFDFANFDEFNVSNNELVGPIPDVQGRFGVASFSGNPGLCGTPLPNVCPPAAPPKKKGGFSLKRFLVYSGYILLGLLIIVLLVAFKLSRRAKRKEDCRKNVKSGTASEVSNSRSNNKSNRTSNSSTINTRGNRSEYSITSMESGMTSSSLVVMDNRLVKKGLRFEDLLRAPAELLGRGKHGSLYKVMLGDRLLLAVKRVRDWRISKEEFRSRMEKIDRAKHPKVLPALALYCSNEEKLLVYEYQPSGSLFTLLHGNRDSQTFDWGSRLSVAVSIAEALAVMHESLLVDGIAHGNLKSTNILFDRDMELWISEYGLMPVDDQDPAYTPNNRNSSGRSGIFSADIFGFGVILLELLTGKMVQNNGYDLATWVQSAVREEWTVEVFDPTLTSEGASEERMVNLLQVALKCINPSAEERPSMSLVAAMVSKIKEDDERSLTWSEA
ncbi:probable inactive receptor kinase At2g26730 [Punica granatum]|uniref:Protein kinase domain-containing protein n=2 Tax=Punica granatum TaxID=22663 RepID=A0A218Y1R9_PUNGR|nr:probable inactive receptor kinase At2g26730 [Punica granatum]OWM90482.1 hypothetical protein CDL15_Pgr014785 [Punica granatum]PKI59153.1 hypothetical protein CRG98_020519 [Punica granatum]